ncbi:MAG: pilus assembly protein [Novosphingobium sp.]|nr:pilus assembly protein [Novosphingobium sp.]
MVRRNLSIRLRRHNLARDTKGAALVEFALILPVLMILLLGTFDAGYNIYTNALLEGAIQKAARDSTIQGASSGQTTIDTNVSRAVRNIVPSAQIDFDRKAYATFSNVAQPEDFTDSNGDGLCNNNEAYEDANNNNQWDADRGRAGFGGARDTVLYTVTVSYDRAFPIYNMINLSPQITTQASTVLRNQPWNIQDTSPPPVRNCP